MLSLIVLPATGVIAAAGYALSNILPPFLRLSTRILVAHAALCGLTVSLCALPAFARRTAWITGKLADGSLHPLAWAVWWPYQLGLRVKLSLGKGLSSEPLMNEVQGGWWVSGWPSAQSDLPSPDKGGVAVLDVTAELPRTHWVGPYLCLPTWDTNGVTVEDMERGVVWALEQSARGYSVVVHCAHGHGRSAAVMAAVMMAQGLALSPRDAEKYMQRSRPKVRLNRVQMASVQEWVAWRIKHRGSIVQGGGGPAAGSMWAMSEDKHGGGAEGDA